MAAGSALEPFSEKGFYLSEFRNRTLAVAVRGAELRHPAPLAALLKELGANATRIVVVSDSAPALADLTGAAPLPADAERLEGHVWRALAERSGCGVLVADGRRFAERVREVALRLALTKLVCVDPGGGLVRPDGGRRSFVGLAELGELLADGSSEMSSGRRELLVEIERALREGLPALNLCTLEGLADELFTYTGSGTLFTRERYVEVRRLGLDDYDAANHLIARGVSEGYLAPRSDAEVESILASALGAFVEGAHLAGVAALLEHREAGAAEIASLYTLTRFAGEGVGAHLIAHAMDVARDRGFAYVFACTTSQGVVTFFERNGFRGVSEEQVPAAKWAAYDPERREHVRCLRVDLLKG